MTAASGFAIDASYGQQDFQVGKGMLLAKGASNGAQRGANQIGPRAAWENAMLVTASYQDFKLQGFWLKPNEEPSTATGTRLTGANLTWLPTGPVRLGAMWIHVPDSEIVTRDDLDVYDLRARVHPIASAPNFWLEADYAWQRKDNVAANGWLLQANYNAKDMAWKPLFDFRYASLSGDKPGTAKWEGFDPLYFGGSNPNWYQGQIGSTIFGNTNLNVASAGVTLTPDEKNIVILRYLYFTAAEINSPLSIPVTGPATADRGRRAQQGAGERIRLFVDLRHRQAAQRQRLRRLRRAGLGIQGSVRRERRQRHRLVVLRRTIQLQLLTRLAHGR